MHAISEFAPQPRCYLRSSGRSNVLTLGPVQLASGLRLTSLRVAISRFGATDKPTLLILGGISSNHQVVTSDGSGWWDQTLDAGELLHHFQIIGLEYPDVAPTASTRDHADLIALALDALGIASLHAVIGSSFGGQVALNLAVHHAAKVQRLVVLCAAHRVTRTTTAYRYVQREIVRLGQRANAPELGVALARSLATIGYRSAIEFEQRFHTQAYLDADARQQQRHVISYLHHQGARHSQVQPAARFLALSQACDLHALDPSAICVPTWLGAARYDQIVPLGDVKALAAQLPDCRGLTITESATGHDAFLTDRCFVQRITDAALHAAVQPEVVQ